uniref:Beta-lactamase-related domain-containing protein n=1 Tax=Haptolina ericina TaxID=156174 RepID=A0A7S3C2B3_9EUKA|mmetsp:Transcript_72418/g.160917  ORF Transcript_72418/g.160917 Transcript_72418/m.160917 type:complete len:147 (+) Transcript_72418:195-635(+)
MTPKFVCSPGKCTSYSSTNYVLAGLVLLSASSAPSWEAVDQTSVFPSRARFPSSTFLTSVPISDKATVSGMSQGVSPKPDEIWTQDGSILGWTCGNLAAPTAEVASFMHELLAGRTVLSPIASCHIWSWYLCIVFGLLSGSSMKMW